MFFLALRFFEGQNSSCAMLCFSEKLKLSCAALCFFEKPKLSCAALFFFESQSSLCAALCFKPTLFFLKNEALKSFLLFVHLQHLINDVSVVGQSWHLVLSAELALRFEPVVEQALPCHHHLEVLQGDVVETLCLIV